MLRYAIFVYGTLMEPIWRHDQYFQNIVAKGFGYLPGELRMRQSGTPIYEPNPESIIATGTSDLSADCDFQREVMGWEKFDQTFTEKTWDNSEGKNLKGMVKGQWILCEDSDEKRLQSLDDLEEFFPGQNQENLYERFLVSSPALLGPVWVYGIPKGKTKADYSDPKNKFFYDMKGEGVNRDPLTGEYI